MSSMLFATVNVVDARINPFAYSPMMGITSGMPWLGGRIEMVGVQRALHRPNNELCVGRGARHVHQGFRRRTISDAVNGCRMVYRVKFGA